MKSNVVFYITEGMVKYLQVSCTQKKQVSGVEILNTTNQSDTQISETLISFKKAHKLNFADSNVTVLIPRSRAILRFMVFPSHNDAEIRSMIDLQVGSRIPYVREEVEIDFQVLSKTEDGYSKVAVVIIPQDIAMRYWKIFSDAQIPINTVTISSIGLWMLYQQQATLTNGPGAVFDLDINSSEICLCSNTQWLTSREIPIGFTQMQQNGYNDIINQWELTQNNSSGEKLTSSIETVYLVSSANRAYALAIELAKIKSDLTIKEIQAPQQLTLAKGLQWPKSLLEDGVSIASLIGIGYSNQTIPINLIPTIVKKKEEQRQFQQQLIIAGVWVSVALISLGLVLGMGFFKNNMQLNKLDNQLQQTKARAFKVKEQLQKINDIEELLKDRLIFSDLSREINRLLPAQVYLVNIVVSDGNTLSLQGVSSNSVAINQFQKDMGESHQFSNVNLDYVNKRVTQQGEVDYFKITCILNNVKASS